MIHMDKTPEEVRRELRYRMATEGAELAYDTAVAICRDPTTSATAKASAINSLLRVAGYDGKPEADAGKAIGDLTPAELQARIAAVDRELGLTGEDDQGVFG